MKLITNLLKITSLSLFQKIFVLSGYVVWLEQWSFSRIQVKKIYILEFKVLPALPRSLGTVFTSSFKGEGLSFCHIRPIFCHTLSWCKRPGLQEWRWRELSKGKNAPMHSVPHLLHQQQYAEEQVGSLHVLDEFWMHLGPSLYVLC